MIPRRQGFGRYRLIVESLVSSRCRCRCGELVVVVVVVVVAAWSQKKRENISFIGRKSQYARYAVR